MLGEKVFYYSNEIPSNLTYCCSWTKDLQKLYLWNGNLNRISINSSLKYRLYLSHIAQIG